MSRPTEIISGDSYEWGVTSNDYPATDGWTLKVTIINASKRVQVTAAADGPGYLVTLKSTDTDDLTAGEYSVIEAVESGSGATLERHTLCAYQIVATPNITGSTVATDTRSHARIVLDAIEAMIEGRASSAQQQISIAGRSIVYIPVPDLLIFKADYQCAVDAEEAKSRAALGLSTGRNIKIRFV